MYVENIIIHHKGFFDYNLLSKLLSDLIEYVERNNIDNYFYKKMQIVMVEMLENNYQYTQEMLNGILLIIITLNLKLLKLTWVLS